LDTPFCLARVAAIAEVTLILIGWGWAQYPNLITPDVSIQNSSAPAATLRLLLIALIIGAVVLFRRSPFFITSSRARAVGQLRRPE